MSESRPVHSSELIGRTIGRYELIAMLGRGGMGEVYRATDTSLGRQVAIKLLPDAVSHDPDRLARFEREARTLALLNHHNIATLYGFERSENILALVMELVEGPTLADRIAQGPIPVAEALALARQIAEALEAAHEQGIVHRDLKPANIKVRPDGAVKVLDFGLAKMADPPASAATSAGVTLSSTITSPAMSAAGMILGTAAYMSPEQARGRPVDKRSDIWAFGAVLYEMVTGQRAFAGDDVSDVLASVLAREPDWSRLPNDLPPSVVQYLKRCLHRDERRRVRDIGDVLLAIEGAFEHEMSNARPGAVVHPPLWRRLWPIAATVAAALAMGTIVAWNLREPVQPAGVTRFDVFLPAGQQLASAGRPVMAVAPDGRSFAYRTQTGLFVRALGDLEPRMVPGIADIAGAPFVSPFYSPDGEWIGYFTLTEHRKLPITGGPSTVIAAVSQATSGSWPETDTILFAERRGIMRVRAGGGEPELIIPAKEGERMQGPRLLPNGSVLFSVTISTEPNRWDRAQIVMQSSAANARTVVVDGGSEPRYLSTGHITYTRGNRLLAVPFDLKRGGTTGAAVPVAENVHAPVGITATGADYDISSSGTLIYLVDDTQTRSPVWVNRDGSLAGAVPGALPALYEDPRLSPDGRRLVITRDGDLWIYDLDSGRNTRVTRDGSSLMGVWNPAGSEIAYSSNASSGLEAWVAAADGSSAPRQITRLGGAVHVDSWSPDGRTLSVHQHLGLRVTIQMVALDHPDQPPHVFADGEGTQAEGADFARDGRHVVYLSNDNGRRDVFVRPFPGPGGRLAVSVNGGREPRWAANGELFFRSLDGRRMFSASTTSSRTTPSKALTIGTPEARFEADYYVAATGSPRPQYDITADGQRFLMLAPTPRSDAAANRARIVVVEHWAGELKRLLP